MESRLDGLIEDIASSHSPDASTPKPNGTQTFPELGSTNNASLNNHAPAVTGISDHGLVLPTVQLQILRRLPCDITCHCTCHQTQRFASPAFLGSIFGNLFLGYAGLPSVFRKCTVLGCRQDAPTIAKMTYRFPRWFAQRAVNIGFSYTYSTGPELLLRLPCVRPAHCDWFICARMGDAEGLKRLFVDKQASSMLPYSDTPDCRSSADQTEVHDVDVMFGLTALHVGYRLFTPYMTKHRLTVIVGCTLSSAGGICVLDSVGCR